MIEVLNEFCPKAGKLGIGNNYCRIQYVTAFFDRFIAKTYCYVPHFYPNMKVEVVIKEMDVKQSRLFSLLHVGKYIGN